MKLFLGIDGGGTKTEFLLVDESGALCARECLQSSYYMQCGFDGVKAILQQGMAAVLQGAGASFAELGGLCAGLAAFGEVEQDARTLGAIVEDVAQGVPHLVVNDVVVGWAGALGLKSGINIVSGTGSIAYGADEQDNSMRCGGWGHQIGDEGSAYWIGKNAIRHFSLQSDGREEKTLLYERMKAHFALERDFDIIDVFHKFNRTQRAKISELVCELAREGDASALSMFDDAASELARMAQAIVCGLSFSQSPILVSGTGGVFRSGDLLLRPLSQALSSMGCVFEAPVLSPAQGAALMAAVRLGAHEATQLVPQLRIL